MKKRSINAINIFLIALIIYLSVEAIITTRYYLNNRKNVLDLQQTIEKLENENEFLQNEIIICTEEEFVEKEAREKLMLAKENETIVYFKWLEGEEEPTVNEETRDFFTDMWQKLLKLFRK
ncbi:MAG: septum formation initiator family protein [Caldisericaceae bacterium]|nr:septum formation initiator family protein [Caldisericaceae bacterium]